MFLSSSKNMFLSNALEIYGIINIIYIDLVILTNFILVTMYYRSKREYSKTLPYFLISTLFLNYAK